MTDREKYLTILDRFYRGRGGSLLTKDESEALDYAISSIKTDLKYDLLYEETKHIADADKMIESTTKNDDVVALNFSDDIDTPNKYQTADGKWHEGRIPTTKNDLGVDWESYKDVDGNSLDDLILEVLQNNFDCGNTYGYKVADEIIALLPSLTPISPKGHWIEQIDCEENCRTLICSNCDRPALHDGDSIWKHKFCPHCGADMREVKEC